MENKFFGQFCFFLYATIESLCHSSSRWAFQCFASFQTYVTNSQHSQKIKYPNQQNLMVGSHEFVTGFWINEASSDKIFTININHIVDPTNFPLRQNILTNLRLPLQHQTSEDFNPLRLTILYTSCNVLQTFCENVIKISHKFLWRCSSYVPIY